MEHAAAWWSEHRPSAPPLKLAIASAFDLLTAMPEIGQRVLDADEPGLRRWVLHGTPYAIFYSYLEEDGALLVVEFW